MTRQILPVQERNVEQPTPGPWEFDGICQIVEMARPHMRVAFLPSDHADYASSVANGYLIARAPTLADEVHTLRIALASATKDHDKTVEALKLVSDAANEHGRNARELAAILERYMNTYPAFRIKNIGAPNSPARIEQERLMQLEDDAKALLQRSKRDE